MELRHLRYFVAVAEEENVTRAAARLHVSQPSLSRQIRDLEEELEVPLFDHGARSLKLTEAGRVFLTEATAVLERARKAVETVQATAGGSRGEIHVGFAPSLNVHILPDVLRRFQQAFPGVKVRLHDLSTRQMQEGLHDGSLQAALMIKTSPHTGKDLIFREVKKFAICVAISPSHRLANVSSIDIDHIVNQELVIYSRSEYPEYYEWLESLFSASGRQPKVVEEHEGSTSLIAALEAGQGVALVQEGFECFSGPRLIVRPLSPPPPPFIGGIAWRKDLKSPAAKNFIETVLLDKN